MNRAFDYNGTIVSQSKPNPVLRTVRKKLQIDSSDRDRLKYYTNGDFVVYLPRVYESVISLRLISAEFPPILVSQGISVAGAQKHNYSDGANVRITNFSKDVAINEFYYYFAIDIEEANKMDETTPGSDKSSTIDSIYAHIPVMPVNVATGSYYIAYNDKSGPENVSQFNPPLRKLDRLHIRTRTHDQQGNQGFMYWTRDGLKADGLIPANTLEGSTSNTDINYTLTFEVEYLENGFDDFSTFESRLSIRN
jgi:hypothetical protein